MLNSSRKNKNRRRPKAQSRATGKRSASKETMLNQEYEKLHAKIGVLEDFITTSAAKQERRSQMRAKNILPPPEQWRNARSKKKNSATKRSSRWQQRQEMARRERSGLTFLVLFGAACALGWWLLNSAV